MVKEYTIYSDRGGARRSQRGSVTTFEALLLPSMGYGTRESAERWAWAFKKANPGLKVEVKSKGDA